MSDDLLVHVSRRQFLLSTAALPLVAAAAACVGSTEPRYGPARLRLHARTRTRGTPLGDDVILGEDIQRAYIRVPATYSPEHAAPLIILFHGNGGRGDTMTSFFGSRTDAIGAVALAPNSMGGTWDAIERGYGTDVSFINQALDETFARCNIDASRIALLGFSDGATYAISLGVSNGDQVAGVVAHSPGYYIEDDPRGTPAFFISHGTSDQIFPIEDSSRPIVSALRARGSSVTFVEFDGGHGVSDDVADQAFAWLQQRFAPRPAP
jgi:predicted esterase